MSTQAEPDVRADRQPADPLTRLELCRAVMAWLAGQDATGLAMQTPTRISRFRADVAAFWSRPGRNPGGEGPGQLMLPAQTVIVECRRNRAACWPDCANSQELSPELLKLRQKQQQLEEKIRRAEPELRRTDMLFEEYTEWQYEKSQSSDYQKLCREIHQREEALYRGTRFEAIMRVRLADFHYLAVPAKTVHPHELATGWGLLWVRNDLMAELVAPAANQHCRGENRLHLVQNIAGASRENVLFANGIRVRDGRISFLPVPHRRQARDSMRKGSAE